MENITKQLKKAAKETRLSVAEKTAMRSALFQYVKANPANVGMVPSPFSINNFRNKKSLSFFVIMGLVMGGSVSFAAENTTPGDVLYPVKIHVNESVRGVVAITPQAKAIWEVQLVERRLQEVEKLAVAPDATPAAQQEAQQNLASYTQHVEDRIEEFENDNDGDDAIKTASALSGVLSVHEQVFAGLNVESSITASVGVVSATSTLSMVATTTADVATTTIAVASVSASNTESIKETLEQIRESLKGAKEKHHELKKKYHKEDTDDNQTDGDNQDSVSPNLVPAPVVAPASIPASSVTLTTTAATGTTGTPVVIPSIIHLDGQEGDNEDRHEEIRSSTNTQESTNMQASSTLPTESTHVESNTTTEQHHTDSSTETRHGEQTHTETTRTSRETSERH